MTPHAVNVSTPMIPKTLHFIWVGDETKRPDNCIDTWAKHNPDYTIKIWGNASLVEQKWLNARHMDAMRDRELNGVADMMRWEILHREGGVVLDADSICLRKLDDHLLDCEAFACWESEIARPGLIAAGYFGCKAENPFVRRIIQDIHDEPSVIDDMAWKTVGPLRLTESYRRYQYFDLNILPSHYFIPEHFSGLTYKGRGPVYANQKWGSTKRVYDELHRQRFDEKGNTIEAPASRADVSASDALATDATSRAKSDAPPVDDDLTQRVQVSTDLARIDRVEALKRFCEGKRVLHVGCADGRVTDPRTSLHLALESVCSKLDGFDTRAKALAALAPHTKGRLYSKFAEIKGQYDLVLVPDVLERVGDVAGFMADLNKVNAAAYLLTVPDASQSQNRHFAYSKASQTFTEVVRADRNCWYTPYTISNVVKKFTPWTLNAIWFFNSVSLLVLATKNGSNKK